MMRLLRKVRWVLPKEANSLGNHRTKGAGGPTLLITERSFLAQVRFPTRTWSPKLEVDSVPIAYDASLRHYCGGHAGHVAKALEQPLLLPKDMEAYRNFNYPELFLSLKRDLAMVMTEGRAYSAAEFQGWMRGAGLKPEGIVPTMAHCAVLTATKPA